MNETDWGPGASARLRVDQLATDPDRAGDTPTASGVRAAFPFTSPIPATRRTPWAAPTTPIGNGEPALRRAPHTL